MSSLTHFEGFARGWFVVAFSSEIASGELRPIRYFARDLVLFRSESGEAAVVDAHCPHLGAHIGFGGEVVGEGVRCPFHAWRFDGRGRCVEIPYASRIPARARLGAYPVVERNGMIFVWHDPEGGQPRYEIPTIETHGDEAWTDWNHDLLVVKTQPWEVMENVADYGHFLPVHDTLIETFSNDFEGHRAVQRSSGQGRVSEGDDGVSGFAGVATYHGPAYQVSEMESFIPMVMVNAHTPVDGETLHLRFAVSIRSVGDGGRSARIAESFVANAHEGFSQDLQIWENKRFLVRPQLCDGDGPIMKLRQWYAQFYRRADEG